MTTLRAGNLTLRFLLELAALAAVAYWGWETGSGITSPLLAAVAVAAVVVTWGLFLSPKRAIELPGALRLALELVVWAVAAAALWSTGHPVVGIAFLVIALCSGLLNYVWSDGVAPST